MLQTIWWYDDMHSRAYFMILLLRACVWASERVAVLYLRNVTADDGVETGGGEWMQTTIYIFHDNVNVSICCDFYCLSAFARFNSSTYTHTHTHIETSNAFTMTSKLMMLYEIRYNIIIIIII